MSKALKKYDEKIVITVIDEDQFINLMAIKQKFVNDCEKEGLEVESTNTIDSLAESSVINIKFTASSNNLSECEKPYLNIGLSVNDHCLMSFATLGNGKSLFICVRHVAVGYIESSTISETILFNKKDSRIDFKNTDSMQSTLKLIKDACENPIRYSDAQGQTYNTKCKNVEDVINTFDIKAIVCWQRDSVNKSKILAMSFVSFMKELGVTGDIIDNRGENLKKLPKGIERPLAILKKILSDLKLTRENEDGQKEVFVPNPDDTIEITVEEVDEDEEEEENSNPLDDEKCKKCNKRHLCALSYLLTKQGFDRKSAISFVNFITDIPYEDCADASFSYTVNKEGKMIMVGFPSKPNEVNEKC